MPFKYRPATQEYVGLTEEERDALDNKKSTSESKPVEKAEEQPKAEKKFIAPAKKKAVAKTPVNLRMSPSPNATILAVLYPTDTVEVEYYNSEYWKLIYKGTECYVNREFIAIQ